jgi:hypothetical protein
MRVFWYDQEAPRLPLENENMWIENISYYVLGDVHSQVVLPIKMDCVTIYWNVTFSSFTVSAIHMLL